jgi:hypothetical protein
MGVCERSFHKIDLARGRKIMGTVFFWVIVVKENYQSNKE